MHRCSNCGQEFEGKFCPECGEPWQDFKQCPNCGVNLIGSVKFCPECGYAFTKMKTAAGQPQATQTAKQELSFKQKPSGAGKWIKSHLKILVPAILGLIVVIVMLSLIPTFIAVGSNGTYYGYYGGEYDESSYVTLKNYKWSDDEGESGKYKLSGKNIKIYATVFGGTKLFAQGTVKNGVLSLDMDGDGKADQIYVTKNHKHKYGDWKTDYEATCTTTGQKTRTCACGVKERREIEVRRHTFGDWEYDYDSHWLACTICGVQVDKEAHKNGEICSVCFYESGSTIGLVYDYVWDFNTYSYNSYFVVGIGTATEPDIVIPSTYKGKPVTSIGSSAFKNCTSLTSVTIPESVTSIEQYAFEYCRSLTDVNIPESVISIGRYAFYGCANTVYDNAEYVGNKSNPYLVLSAANDIDITSCTINENTKVIADEAFYGCTGLTSITIPNSVTSIGWSAFSDCSGITSVTIGNGVTSIGYYAFCYCSSLTSITVASENTVYHSSGNCLIETASKTLIAGCKNSFIPTDGSVTIIGGEAFGGCSSLTTITIPDSVTTIGVCAFYNCSSLTSITISDSVKEIVNGAFGNCSSLTDVYFKGSKRDWAAISINIGNTPLTNATIHYNYNG